jgi:hypothetical protein
VALPAAVQYGQVTWKAVLATADGVDVDGNPDAVPVTGTVKFTPSATVLLATGEVPPVTVFGTTLTYTLDSSGVLRDSEGRSSITLVATDSAGLTPVGWTWDVTYLLNGGASRGSFSFSLPAGTVVDLTSVAPVTASGGVPVIQGPAGPAGPTGPAGPAGTAGATSLATIYVASATASTAEKALAGATYTCDGTADDVQIQAAYDAVYAAGGGRVVLSAGTFFIATAVQCTGPNNNLTHRHVTIQGAGLGTTNIRPLFNVSSGFHLTNRAQVDILDMSFECYGSSSGVTSAATASGTWAFWYCNFKNLFFLGSSDGNSTGWAMNLEGPFRSMFENIDGAGMVNGIRLYAAAPGFFAGNCSFNRVFMLTYGSNGFGFKLDAATGNILNAIEFNVCEGFADGGTGNTAVQLGGSGGQVNHTRWNTTNFESYDTVFRVNNGFGNIIDGDYWDIRGTAASNVGTLVQFDANAKGNWVKSITGHYTAIAHRLVVSTATDTVMPNIVENVALVVDTGGAVTNSIGTAGAVITKAITAEGANAAGASTVTKKILPFAKVIHGATSTVARPHAEYVLWEGSVQPGNWIDGDDWNQV